MTGVNDCEAFGVAPWDAVILVPDPDNEVDKDAIKVFRQSTEFANAPRLHVGWVKAEQCRAVHEFMSGRTVTVRVHRWAPAGGVIELKVQ